MSAVDVILLVWFESDHLGKVNVIWIWIWILWIDCDTMNAMRAMEAMRCDAIRYERCCIDCERWSIVKFEKAKNKKISQVSQLKEVGSSMERLCNVINEGIGCYVDSGIKKCSLKCDHIHSSSIFISYLYNQNDPHKN